MDDDDRVGYGLKPVLAFDTDDPQFALGFEAGRIWEQLKREDYEAVDGQPIHAKNCEVVLRMGDALGAPISADFTDDEGWMILHV